MADTGAEKLIKLYETAMKELYREIARREGLGNSTVYQRRLLEKVREVLKKLKRGTPGAVREAIEAPYLKGVREAAAELGIRLEPRVDWQQLNILMQNVNNQLTLATNRVGRMWEDAIRRAGIEATRHKLSSGQTVNQMRRQLLEELMGIGFTQQGIPAKGFGVNKAGHIGVKTRRGVMRLEAYAALVARSTTAEAQNAAKLERAQEYGCDLVRFTKHAPCCAKCAQFEDRLYALTAEAAGGKYKGPSGEALSFPLLYDTAFIGGYDNIHPNCRHRLILVVSERMTPEELAAWSKKSMRPFIDNRSERDRKAYAKAQADNRARWNDRRQWEQYRAVLPDQTPDNFGVFRSMKKSNAQGWRDLQEDYRTVVKILKDGIIDVGSDAMRTGIQIDTFTPCLEDTRTGEFKSTIYSRASQEELSLLRGWNFDWQHPSLAEAEIYKLCLKGSKNIEGLVAVTRFDRDKAVYVNLAESAPHNLGKDKRYSGVGGHLFAIAAQRSKDLGYGGFFFMDAKNRELVQHYQEALGATLLGIPHEYRMFVDEEAAEKLLSVYTLKEAT